MQEYTPTPDFYNDYLAHHGILGMRWGHRNGPPYPLNSSVSTGKKLKKADRIDKKLQKKHNKHVKKADRDFQKSHRLFETDSGSSYYVRKNLSKDETMKDGIGRYQTLSLKAKNGKTEHYTIDRKYNAVVEKTISDDKTDKEVISNFDKTNKDLISQLEKKRQKQWDRERGKIHG